METCPAALMPSRSQAGGCPESKEEMLLVPAVAWHSGTMAWGCPGTDHLFWLGDGEKGRPRESLCVTLRHTSVCSLEAKGL